MTRIIENSVAIIPARKNSITIKNKNLRLLKGKPLIAWTILQALESNIQRVIVTTDSEEIRDIAEKYGAEVPFLRSEKLSGSKVAIEPVLIDVIDYLNSSEQYSPECIALLMPTSPFRDVKHIDQALNIFKSTNCSAVISVIKAVANNNPHWMLKIVDSGRVRLFTGESLSKIKSRRQDLPDAFIRNDFVYIFKPENLYMNPPGLYGDSPELMVVDSYLDVDINTERDWVIAENVFSINLNRDK